MRSKEEWRILDFAPHVSVSSMGRVRGPYRLLNPGVSGRGYYRVDIHIGSKKKTYFVHRLILYAFKGPSDLMINHKNGIKIDNRLCNLEYCTAQQNSDHAVKAGLIRARGERHHNSKLTEQEAYEVFYCSVHGLLPKDVASAYGVSRSVVSLMLNNKSWKYCPAINELRAALKSHVAGEKP